MATYRLSSQISPAGARGHRISVSATAAGQVAETLHVELVETVVEAESRRAILLVLVEEHLRRRGHAVADLVEDPAEG